LEALRLRVKDVGFSRREIVVREGKGHKDRMTVLPENLIASSQRQLQLHRSRALHERMCRQVRGGCMCRMRWR